MIPVPESKSPRLVVIGGGFAGIKLVKSLKGCPVQIVLFDRNNYHTFQPLLYQVATAGLEPDSIADPLRKQLEGMKDFYFRMAEVYSIDSDKSQIQTEIGDLSFDYLVIATGSKTNYFGNKSILENSFPLKQIPQALDLRSHILQNFEAATITENTKDLTPMMNIVVVGGGPTGVELAGALGELKKNILPSDYPELNFDLMNIYLVEGGPELLGSMSGFASKRAKKYVEKFGVKVRLDLLVESYDNGIARFSNGVEVPTNTLIWAAGVQGNYPSGLSKDVIAGGRLTTDDFNRVKGYERIFAIGDIANMTSEYYPKGHPMVAPVAIQQGRQLSGNIKRMLRGKEMIPFKYTDKGSMATIGRNKAVVDMPGNLKFGGFAAWLVWMFVHLVSIIGFRNRLIVFSNWVWNYFTYDKGTRLIIRKFIPSLTRNSE